MSKIKNGGLDQYADEPFEQQQFGTVEGVKRSVEEQKWMTMDEQWCDTINLLPHQTTKKQTTYFRNEISQILYEP